jgi:hypothetical protein
LITYLRTNLPSWSIDGAVELAIAKDKSRLRLPAMYVGLGDFAITKTNHETYEQEWELHFNIITCTPTTEADDRTGKYAQDFVTDARIILNKLLVNNMSFDRDAHAIEALRDRFEDLDAARYYHRFEFKMVGLYRPEDATPMTLDYFDKLFVDYVVEGSTDATPPTQQQIEIDPLYPRP